MIHRIFLILIILFGAMAAEGQIKVISNLYNDQVMINIFKKQRSQLVLFNPIEIKAEKIPMPKLNSKEEIIGLFIFETGQKDNEEKNKKDPAAVKILIKQWTMGYGKPPQVLKLTHGVWKSVGTLDCISFDQIEFAKNELKVQCEAERLNKKGKHEVTLKLDFSLAKSQKFVLPLSETSSKQARIVLNGSLLSWDKMQITKTGSKIPVEVKSIDL